MPFRLDFPKHEVMPAVTLPSLDPSTVRETRLLSLPALSLLCGCQALTRGAEAIDYRPGEPPATMVAKVDGTYSLYAPNAYTSWAATDVTLGSAVGFRQEPNGTITAFAGEQTWPIDASDGRHVWLYTPKPATEWDRFLVNTRDKTESAVGTMLLFLTAPILELACAVTGQYL